MEVVKLTHPEKTTIKTASIRVKVLFYLLALGLKYYFIYFLNGNLGSQNFLDTLRNIVRFVNA